MSIVRQHEAVKAGASVVPGDVDALVDTAPVVVVILTLVNICKLRGVRDVRGETWRKQEEHGGPFSPHG